MTTRQLILIVIVWLVANAIYPLLLNSLERLYQNRIDRFTQGVVRFGIAAAILCINVILFVILLPSILLVFATEKTLPSLYKHKFFEDMQYAIHLVTKFRWFPIAKEELRRWRRNRQQGMTRVEQSAPGDSGTRADDASSGTPEQ